MKILVTGAAGFIGFHLCKKLLERGDEVVGYDNLNDYYDIRLKYGRLNECGIQMGSISYGKLIKSVKYGNYKFIEADLTDKDKLFNLFKCEKFDAVCNLAAQAGVRYSLENPYTYIDSNISGFLNILESCRNYNVKQLAYASSSSVYGSNDKQPFSTTDNVDHPISLYAATKKANELMAHTYGHLFNISTTGLRFFTVYGPWGRPDMALFLFTKAILENKPIDIYNHGDMKRDFTYIDDIVSGVINVLDKPASVLCKKEVPYKIYNIGNSQPVNLMDFVNAIEKKLEITAKKNFLPMQMGDVQSTWADVNELESDFNYKPKTKIDFGVGKFIDWYLEFYKDSYQN